MKIANRHISAIEALGYTADESRFLYIVATHSGYFVPRQFVAFTGASWGRRSQHFTEKLVSRGHANWREYHDVGGVYHLFSRRLYRLMERENLRNRRGHSIEFIRTRLLLLDFILANLTHDYFELEQDKVRYFSEELAIPKKVLPAKAYESVSRSEPTLRYFVDKFPLFLDSSASSSSPVVTLSYLDPGQASRAGLAKHLNAYTPLFRHLSHFRFLYIASSAVHFVRAERCFTALVKVPFEERKPAEMERYFRLRAAWDGKQYAELSNDDIEWLDHASQRFHGPEIERLYAAWGAGAAGNQEWRALVAEAHPQRTPEFGTCLIAAGCQAKPQELRTAG
jgi:hypothetical protein